MSSTNPLYICGSLASGKSALAVSLAKELGGEVVNGDVAQAFDGLGILSGAPTDWKKGDIAHHLYGVLKPTDICGPAAYRALAMPVIEHIQSRGKVPIIVGGSGLYLKTLTHGASAMPERDDALRASFEERTIEDLAKEFSSLDPEGAAASDLNNRHYVVRALEVCLVSGEKMSELKAEEARKFGEVSKNLRGLYLLWDDENTKQRISSRTMHILENGGIEEVKALREAAGETCRKTIGFSEVEQHLDGKLDLKECHKGFHTSTRRSSKRQRSWLKKEAWLETIQYPVAFDAKVGSFREQ